MARNQMMKAMAMAQPPQPAQQQPVSRIKPVMDQMMKDPKYGRAADIMALPTAKLVAILQDPGATVYARAKACQRLAVVGDKSAVPALAALLTDPQLSHYARTGLETNPDPSASDALRAALGKVKGAQLVGVISSIGKRRDRRAIRQLEELRHHADIEVCRAADSALALIRPLL
jgi:HEAT repeat protein